MPSRVLSPPIGRSHLFSKTMNLFCLLIRRRLRRKSGRSHRREREKEDPPRSTVLSLPILRSPVGSSLSLCLSLGEERKGRRKGFAFIYGRERILQHCVLYFKLRTADLVYRAHTAIVTLLHAVKEALAILRRRRLVAIFIQCALTISSLVGGESV